MSEYVYIKIKHTIKLAYQLWDHNSWLIWMETIFMLTQITKSRIELGLGSKDIGSNVEPTTTRKSASFCLENDMLECMSVWLCIIHIIYIFEHHHVKIINHKMKLREGKKITQKEVVSEWSLVSPVIKVFSWLFLSLLANLLNYVCWHYVVDSYLYGAMANTFIGLRCASCGNFPINLEHGLTWLVISIW